MSLVGIVCLHWPETYKYSMTFLPIFGNLRKIYALDCGEITFINVVFLFNINLLVFILDFVYTWIYLFESSIRLFNKYTRRNVNNFNKPNCNNSLHAG